MRSVGLCRLGWKNTVSRAPTRPWLRSFSPRPSHIARSRPSSFRGRSPARRMIASRPFPGTAARRSRRRAGTPRSSAIDRSSTNGTDAPRLLHRHVAGAMKITRQTFRWSERIQTHLLPVSDAMTAQPSLPSDEEAMVLPIGAPMVSSYALFEGALSDVRAKVQAMADAERAEIAIWTPGHIVTADQLLAELPGHEHDPIAAADPRQQASGQPADHRSA